MGSTEPLDGAMKPPFSNILISGAGPAGLLLALLLTTPSPTPTTHPPLTITILESWSNMDTRLRATQYGVPATRVFARVPGLLPEIRRQSIESFPSICWRRTRGGGVAQDGKPSPDHERLTGVDLSVIRDHDERMVICPLNKLTEIMYGMLKDRAGVRVLFEHEVAAVGQDGAKAWVDVLVKGDGGRKVAEAAEGEVSGSVEVDLAREESRRGEGRLQRFEAEYVIGCDGSRSAVRRGLFGKHWPGVTFDCHLSVQNVWYDGFAKHNWDGGNYMIDPEYWGLIARRGKGGLWRVTYGDNRVGLTDAEYEARREKAFEVMLPGHPKPGEYTVTQTDHFNTHNRCVDSMRVGRVLLAGDAGHVNNPWGGYGCMAAVLDVGGLAQCLQGVYEGKADDSILDLYSQVRREKYLKYIDARSKKNYNRIRYSDPQTVLQEDKLLGIFQDIEGDSEKTKAFLLKTSSIEYDFSQHYTR